MPCGGTKEVKEHGGTAALSDARSLLSIAISHNMDNVNPMKQTDLARYMGLVSGGTQGAETTDSSGSKVMTIDETTQVITYTYSRGGVSLVGTINVPTQRTTWNVTGVTGNTNRQQAIAEGLKVDMTNTNVINFT